MAEKLYGTTATLVCYLPSAVSYNPGVGRPFSIDGSVYQGFMYVVGKLDNESEFYALHCEIEL